VSSTIARIPNSIDFATAAALPTAGLTALQLVRDFVGAKPGLTLLIQGAAGGVGSYAAQIAIHSGARVVGTASSADLEYLKSLGVNQVIDYKRERFEDRVGGVDAVIDLVGGDTLARSYRVVKKGGVLETTVQSVKKERARQSGIRVVHF